MIGVLRVKLPPKDDLTFNTPIVSLNLVLFFVLTYFAHFVVGY